MKKILKWALTNGAMGYMLWLGFVGGIEGAVNVTVTLTWLMFVTTFALFLVSCVDEHAVNIKMPVSSVVGSLDHVYDAAVFMFLVWHGAIFTGIAYLMHAIFIYWTRNNVEAAKAKVADAAKADQS